MKHERDTATVSNMRNDAMLLMMRAQWEQDFDLRDVTSSWGGSAESGLIAAHFLHRGDVQ
jgi:hypothetical protein